MSIWLYQNKSDKTKDSIVISELCIFCNSNMQEIYEKKLKKKNAWNFEHVKRIRICPVCGWWTVIKKYGENGPVCGDPTIYQRYGAAAVLKKLDLTDISTPIEDVSQYLVAKYDDRFTMHPRLFEETVAAVFRNIGYYAQTTAYQKDGGIDIVLEGKDHKVVGVQVKRHKNSIKVSQIREFAGALIENDMTKGIFVTTSRFQSGAFKSATNFEKRGIGIELIDSNRFYDALQIKKIDQKDYDELIGVLSKVQLEETYRSDGFTLFEKE